MCDALSIGLAISGAVSSIGSTLAARSQGKASRKALTAQRQAEAEQQSDQAEEQLGQRIRAARRERARARVAAAEGGVGGQSFALQLKDSLFQQDLDTANIQKNLAISGKAGQARFAGAFSSTPNPNALDFLGAGLSGAGAGLQIGNAIPFKETPSTGPNQRTPVPPR